MQIRTHTYQTQRAGRVSAGFKRCGKVRVKNRQIPVIDDAKYFGLLPAIVEHNKELCRKNFVFLLRHTVASRMPLQIMEDFYFRLPDDVPLHENQLDYVRVKRALDYHAACDLRDSIIQCSEYLTGNPGASLIEGAANGDGEKRLEIAIRSIGHYLSWPQFSTQTTKMPLTMFPMNFSRWHSRAHVELYKAACDEGDAQLANQHVHTATTYPDAAISRGLTSSIALHLWHAMDKRDEEMAAEERKRDAKVTKAPNAYMCAAKGCGVEGKGATGPPIGCSELEILQDWPIHKKIYKPGREVEDRIQALDPGVLAALEGIDEHGRSQCDGNGVGEMQFTLD
ncbi:hypothetical protein C8R45DRAFT_939902 [Mycena sanguinolenta]|nr:hypothetical protein C8R45DRAFT_939902 [Mycena sanguinolenta]